MQTGHALIKIKNDWLDYISLRKSYATDVFLWLEATDKKRKENTGSKPTSMVAS